MNILACRKVLLASSISLVALVGHAQQAVTTPGGTKGYIPKFSGAATVANSLIFDTGTTVGIGVGATPNSGVKLDIGGGMIVRGNTIVSRTANATASKGYPSWGFEFFSNAYNSSTKASDNPYFVLQSEPTGNNTASPSATFNLLFSNNGAAAAETGFYINPNGTLHFASSQTFPIAAGPQGPVGPTGPQGPQGPTGPAGGLALPYSGSGSTSAYAFEVGNTGTGPGVHAYGGTALDGNETLGGFGLIAQGGSSAGDTATNGSSGGLGIEAIGGNGYVNGSHNEYGGAGAYLIGGDNGGYGAVIYGSSGQGGVGLEAYPGNDGGQAASFFGNVYVGGNLSKAGGSFMIDDPIDPANKYLSHSFVESPDMMNIYNGNAVTDGRGEAVVTMPPYFEALNRDFRYQLTVIGQFAQAIVGSEIAGRAFTIRTDKPNVKVSWQVTGIRQDAWANAHRIPEEEDKPIERRGRYLNPELFGHAGDANILETRYGRPQKSGALQSKAPRQ